MLNHKSGIAMILAIKQDDASCMKARMSAIQAHKGLTTAQTRTLHQAEHGEFRALLQVRQHGHHIIAERMALRTHQHMLHMSRAGQIKQHSLIALALHLSLAQMMLDQVDLGPLPDKNRRACLHAFGCGIAGDKDELKGRLNLCACCNLEDHTIGAERGIEIEHSVRLAQS